MGGRAPSPRPTADDETAPGEATADTLAAVGSEERGPQSTGFEETAVAETVNGSGNAATSPSSGFEATAMAGGTPGQLARAGTEKQGDLEGFERGMTVGRFTVLDKLGVGGMGVRALKAKYPGVPVVTYVNTTAEVKAETDVCCTSANAVEVVESLETDRVIFLPDEYLGKWVAANTDVEIILWNGHCEVHEQFSVDEIERYRRQFPGVQVIAHPECDIDVLEAADMVGSTSGMIRWVDEQRPERVVMITECSMSDNVAAEFPEVEFVRPCTICPHMKRITLEGIVDSLEKLQHPVEVPAEVAIRARRAVERMLEVGRGAGG